MREEIEIKLVNLSNKLNAKVSQGRNIRTPAKILGGLALGAMLMTATALPIGTIHADEPGSPLVAVATSTINYADEFGDVEPGLVAARIASTTIGYIDEFENL